MHRFGVFILIGLLSHGIHNVWAQIHSLKRVELIQTILNSPSHAQGDAFCRSFQVFSVATELSSILLELDRKRILNPDWIKYQWSSQSKFGESVASAIDSSSKYVRDLRAKSISFHGLEKPSQFAGGDAKNYAFPSENAATFFSKLFEEVEASSRVWNPVALGRWDLFHAHMVYAPEISDLLLVFHAKEYPQGNPALCDQCGLTSLFKMIGEFPPSSVQMNPPTIAYQRRNFLVSMKRERICGVNTAVAPFSEFAQEDGDSATLDESKLSSLGEKGEILNINYFPKEGVPVFLEFHRGSAIELSKGKTAAPRF